MKIIKNLNIVIFVIMLCCITTFTSCDEDNNQVMVSTDTDSANLSGTQFGRSVLIKIGDGLWYDSTTRIVYWYDDLDNAYDTPIPSPYYAPNGLPYRYNPETSTFEEIKED